MRSAAAWGLCLSLNAFWVSSAQQNIEDVVRNVSWEFRPGGVQVDQVALAHQLSEARLIEGQSIRFTWDEGQFHGLYRTSSLDAFRECRQEEGELIHSHVVADVVETPPVGTHYYLDPVMNSLGTTNCEVGLKIVVRVYTAETFEPLDTTPSATVIETTARPSDAIQIVWTFEAGRDQYTALDITADDAVTFTWRSSSSAFAVRQVTAEAFAECHLTEGVVQDWAPISVRGDVFVSGLAVGPNFFISTGASHCSDGGMRLQINVIPGLVRMFATVWTEPSTPATAAPVNITLVGHDRQGRPWSSPARQINQRARLSNHSEYETLPIGGSGGALFELFAMDVGAVAVVRLKRTAGETWAASYIQLAYPDATEAMQPRIFRCTATALHVDDDDLDDQFCVPVQSASEVSATPAPPTPAAPSCSCFREFVVSGDRVLACTPDGCFSTSSEADSGWGEVPEIARLHGIGSDSRLYGATAANATVVSPDDGLSWAELSQTQSPLVDAAVEYTVDTSEWPTFRATPSSAHTRQAGRISWGVTAQGVMYNADGEWVLHGTWSCDCQGTCGMECNQPAPNLLDPTR